MPGFDSGVIFGTNIDLSGASQTSGSATLTTDGKMLIASTALNAGGTHVNVGTLTSPSGTVTIGYATPNITIDIAGSSQAVEHLTGDTGGILNPSANNFNILGATGGVNWRTSGAASTITGRSDILNRTVPGAYPYTALDSDYIIEVDTSSARTINLPNAPTTGKSHVIKDVIGSAATNNITLTTVGGSVTIDGSTSRTLVSNYVSATVYFNGTSYFII